MALNGPRPQDEPPPLDAGVEADSVVEMLVQIDESEGAIDPQQLVAALPDPLDAEADDALRRATSGLELLNRVRERNPYCVSDLAYGYAANPDDTGQLTHIGRFEIRRRLGMGGFGVVFLAYDPAIDREVALKVPRVETLINEQTRARFVRESRNAAMVSHPHVATIYEAGTVGPICYIVSEFCRGGSIAGLLERLPAGRIPPRAAAEVMAVIADAVTCAHERGVLHRDIKPTNLLLDFETGELQEFSDDLHELSAHVKLVDFGLAKNLNQDEGRTRTGILLGTPAYTAPEQIAETREVDARADVYSMGATLYHLITGHAPLKKETDFATLMANQHEDPTCPRALHADIPRDLAAICLKCLEKEPARRYQSAAELAADLRRFAEGRPVMARRVSTAGRWWRVALRNPLLSVAVLVTALSLALSITTVSVSLRRFREQEVKQSELIEQIRLLNERRHQQRAETPIIGVSGGELSSAEFAD